MSRNSIHNMISAVISLGENKNIYNHPSNAKNECYECGGIQLEKILC